MSSRVNSWSISRLSDYQECPFKFRHKHLEKTCTICFKGHLSGGYDRPALCDSCGGTPEKPAPLTRGTELGANLEKYVNGETSTLNPENAQNRTVKGLALGYRKVFKRNKGAVLVEQRINLDRNWGYLPPDPRRPDAFNPNTWLIVKLDLLIFMAQNTARVIDWKTGGIDKRTGQIRDDAKYEDQLALYGVATLIAYPQIVQTSSALVFVDAPPGADPVVEKDSGTLKRSGIARVKRMFEIKVKPLFSDTTFGPKPNPRCKWCEYRKEKGGPCVY